MKGPSMRIPTLAGEEPPALPGQWLGNPSASFRQLDPHASLGRDGRSVCVAAHAKPLARIPSALLQLWYPPKGRGSILLRIRRTHRHGDPDGKANAPWPHAPGGMETVDNRRLTASGSTSPGGEIRPCDTRGTARQPYEVAALSTSRHALAFTPILVSPRLLRPQCCVFSLQLAAGLPPLGFRAVGRSGRGNSVFGKPCRPVTAAAGLPFIRRMAVGRRPRENAHNPQQLLRLSHRPASCLSG